MLTLMGGCLGRKTFREQVEAARIAGFQAVSLWPNVWRYALRKEGLSLRDMRKLLDDNGIALTDIEGCRDWARRSQGDAGISTKHGFSRDDYLEACAELGARNVGAVYLKDAPFDLPRLGDAFAALCEDAAAYGLGVALEFVAFSDISDAATAAEVIRRADQPNGGLVVDLWHHARGKAKGDDDQLRALPAGCIYSVQFCDGPVHSSLPLEEETTFHRLMPGEGGMGVYRFLRLMRDLGVAASYGPEVWRPAFDHQDAASAARALMAATREVAAGVPGLNLHAPAR